MWHIGTISSWVVSPIKTTHSVNELLKASRASALQPRDRVPTAHISVLGQPGGSETRLVDPIFAYYCL
jgi:hypothetical protein